MATFVYVVEIGLLAHGGQQVQDAGVDADFLITVLLPGVVLDHVEQLSNKKQDSMFRVVLVEDQNKRINNPKCEAEEGKKKIKTETQVPPFSSYRETEVPAVVKQ